MKYFVYVIKSEEGFHYTGYTSDLNKRLIEHNDKALSFWTKRGNNWKLVYSKEFNSTSEAIQYEKWLKTGKGRDFLKNNIVNF